jgi:hypothetical protein
MDFLRSWHLALAVGLASMEHQQKANSQQLKALS